MDWRVAVVGCGGVSRCHTRAYLALPGVEVVGAADPSSENRRHYSEEFGIESLYEDAAVMLGEIKPDVVSVCTPNPLHARLSIMAAEMGVKGIVCEKPMALNLVDADRMIEVCKKNNVRLVVNHQRRFEQSFMVAKELLKSGAIGRLLRMEANIGDWDLMSWGTHWLDIFRYYNDDEPTEWVFGQVDISKPKAFFGNTVESSGLARIRYANGVDALYQGGETTSGMNNRLFGTEGVIEVEPCCPEGIGGPIRLLNSESNGWKIIDIPQEDHVQQPFARAFGAFLEALESGSAHPMDAESGREALAQIIGVYESARSRKVVRFPIDTQDNPMLAMTEGK